MLHALGHRRGARRVEDPTDGVAVGRGGRGGQAPGIALLELSIVDHDSTIRCDGRDFCEGRVRVLAPQISAHDPQWSTIVAGSNVGSESENQP